MIRYKNYSATVLEQHAMASASINLYVQDGRTPLVLASNNGRNKVIQLLLNHGAKIDFPNIDVRIFHIIFVASCMIVNELQTDYGFYTCRVNLAILLSSVLLATDM